MRLAVALLALLVAASAHAAGGGGHHDEGIPWLTLLFSTINVVLFILVLRRYAWPIVRNWVQERHDRIVRDLNAADEARAEALKIKAEWEKRLADLEGSIEKMREQARQDAERERERILEEARRTAARLERDAEQAAAAEIRQLRAQLRAELTASAIRLAEQSARAQWTEADQERFVADFLEQVQP